MSGGAVFPIVVKNPLQTANVLVAGAWRANFNQKRVNSVVTLPHQLIRPGDGGRLIRLPAGERHDGIHREDAAGRRRSVARAS
jgi:hypothetical protein